MKKHIKGTIAMIEKAISAMSRGDYKAFSECFSEDCKYFDYCPSLSGRLNYFVYGRATMEMFFRNCFTFKRLVMTEPQIEDEKKASFFGSYEEGPYQFARFEIEEYDASGLIKKAVVHPA